MQMAKQYSEEMGMDVPPQLMFLHQGQNNMKEVRFHPQFRTLMFTTAEDSFNVFRPNLDPDYEEPEEVDHQESIDEKESESTKITKMSYEKEDDEEMEGERLVAAQR